MLSQSIQSWVREKLAQPEVEIMPLAGDASHRSYYRVLSGNHTYVLMISPPEKEDPTAFIAIAQAWHQAGIPVPQLYAIEPRQGYLLLEDFGDLLYSKALNQSRADELYPLALQALNAVSQAPVIPNYRYPAFDESFMWKECGYVFEWLLPHHLQFQPSHQEEQQLKQEMGACISAITEQPQCVVHRDYHSRNLLLRPSGQLGIIDFQDAVIGPLLYDPVSLLKDAYVQWPEAQVWKWLENFWANTHTAVSFETFQWWFDMVSIQRHLKVLGIFARLAYRDGKKGYLNDMPVVANYLVQTLGRYPEWSALNHLLKHQVLPMMEQA